MFKNTYYFFMLFVFSQNASALVANFDDVSLPGPNTANVAGFDTQFTSGGITFNQDWNEMFNCCASGWFASNGTDTTTPGFANQYSAITGTGVNGSSQYGVANLGNADINFDIASIVNGLYLTNTTYAYLAIQNGDDGNNPPFVKGPFGSNDFFTLTISGFDQSNTLTNSIDIDLWDATEESALDEWLWVDLTGLGTVNSLSFALASSDSGSFGINTPAYFAIDDLTVQPIPLPPAIWLFAPAVLGLFRYKR